MNKVAIVFVADAALLVTAFGCGQRLAEQRPQPTVKSTDEGIGRDVKNDEQDEPERIGPVLAHSSKLDAADIDENKSLEDSLEWTDPVLKALNQPGIPSPGEGIETNALEAIFRHMMASFIDPESTCFLAVYVECPKDVKTRIAADLVRCHADPSAQLMARFRNHEPAVKPKSYHGSNGGEIIDRETGKSGILFSARIIHWVSRDSVVVEAEEYRNPSDASGRRYLLKRIDGKWKVTASELGGWIS